MPALAGSRADRVLRTKQGGVVGCAAEALPAAETAEAEQGPRSVFCESAATLEAKAGHRNPEQGGAALLRLADFCGAPRRALAKTGALRQLRPGCFVHWTRRAKAALDPKAEVAAFKSLKNTVMPGP